MLLECRVKRSTSPLSKTYTNSMFFALTYRGYTMAQLYYPTPFGTAAAAKEVSTKTNLCAHRPFLHRVALKSDVFHDPGALNIATPAPSQPNQLGKLRRWVSRVKLWVEIVWVQ